MEMVGGGVRYHVNLCTARGSGLSGVIGGAHTELGYGIQCDVEAGVGLLRLLLDTAGVHSIEREVAVIERMAGEADAALGAVAVVDGCRSEQHQAGPVASADRDLLDLGGLDDAAHLGVGAIHRFGGRRYR